MKYPLIGAALSAMFAIKPAFAHAVLETGEAMAGTIYRGAIGITHGCKGSPTVSVDLTIPEGVIGVKPVAKPGWKIETHRGLYARQYPTPRGLLKEGVKEIVWSGGSLPDDFVDDFEFRGRIAATATGTLYFPVVQSCAEGEHRWVEIPQEGRDAADLDHPAPALIVLAANDPAIVSIGALKIEGAFARPTPGGATVAAGYVTIVNTGKEPDRLVSATSDISARTEIHSMTMSNGIMEMHELKDGLPIPAGATVALKPGGDHIMFVDIKHQVKPGEVIHATLIFAKAGKVVVAFKAAHSMGAMSPDGGMGGMGGMKM